MDFILNQFILSLQQVALSLQHNWMYLLAGILISALLKRYLNAEKASAFLNRFRGVGVLAATGVAVTTPLCSCGTTAVILGMMASAMSWAPIVAFMVSSPLSSPEELFYSAGLFGWHFATTFFLVSILLGLAGGGIAMMLEKRGWLANQTRFIASTQKKSVSEISLQPAARCACDQGASRPVPAPAFISAGMHSRLTYRPAPACTCSEASPAIVEIRQTSRIASSKITGEALALLKEMAAAGKQLLPMFLGFAFIGYFINNLIPAGWVSALFGGGKVYSVPLAATLGLPFYINTEGALPLIRAFLDAGMSRGAAMAFMISGAGTSIGAVAGAFAIARWRVVALVVGILWVGAILAGYGYDLLLGV